MSNFWTEQISISIKRRSLVYFDIVLNYNETIFIAVDKINREIDFMLKQRDEVALQIAESNKVINQMTKEHVKVQKTNKRLKEQIDQVRLRLSMIET